MSTLTLLTLIVVGLVVAVLVGYLIAIIVALRRAGTHLENLAGGLQKVVDDTAPLEERVTTVNGALDKLRRGLGSVDGHLVGIARVLNL